MNYTELNEKLEQLREIVRQQLIKEKEANENAQVDKDLITWQPEELTQLLGDILDAINGLNERVRKLERKLKE